MDEQTRQNTLVLDGIRLIERTHLLRPHGPCYGESLGGVSGVACFIH